MGKGYEFFHFDNKLVKQIEVRQEKGCLNTNILIRSEPNLPDVLTKKHQTWKLCINTFISSLGGGEWLLKGRKFVSMVNEPL